MPISPRTWKQQLNATTSPSNRQHGIDSGFQCSDQAERQGQNARQMLTKPSQEIGNTDIALSVITLIELTHGAFRADTAQRKAKRQQLSRNWPRQSPFIQLPYQWLFMPGRSTVKVKQTGFGYR